METRSTVTDPIEEELWSRGIAYVAGVDEAGRGALAGPVVAAAVVLPPGHRFSSLVRDSKQLTPRQREHALEEIRRAALAVATGWVGPEWIDRINIRQATRLAMRRALMGLGVVPDHVLVDAETIDLPVPQTSLVKGDQISPSIAAASIVAKVVRDRFADVWHRQYPAYGFCRHRGYATKEHRAAIVRLGPCPLHRSSFLRGLLTNYWQETLPFR